jgi:hypothetical protein
MIPLVIFVIAPKIAQHSIDTSKLTFDSASISKATNNSFVLSSSGTVSDAGALDATIEFPDPVDIYWTNYNTSKGETGPDVLLGSMRLTPLTVSGALPKSGPLNVSNVEVTVKDVEAMSKFSAYLIKGSSFQWKLKGAAAAKAMGLTFSGLKMEKIVTLAGFDGLTKVSIDKFDLPDSDPSRGIRLVTSTTLENPSAITIDLGALYFNASYNNRAIGTLEGTNVSLKPGTNKLSLNGRLSAIDPADTQSLSDVFTMFVGGVGSKMKVTGTRVVSESGPVNWLNAGFVGLDLFVTLNPPDGQMQLVSELQVSLHFRFGII